MLAETGADGESNHGLYTTAETGKRSLNPGATPGTGQLIISSTYTPRSALTIELSVPVLIVAGYCETRIYTHTHVAVAGQRLQTPCLEGARKRDLPALKPRPPPFCERTIARMEAI